MGMSGAVQMHQRKLTEFFPKLLQECSRTAAPKTLNYLSFSDGINQ